MLSLRKCAVIVAAVVLAIFLALALFGPADGPSVRTRPVPTVAHRAPVLEQDVSVILHQFVEAEHGRLVAFLASLAVPVPEPVVVVPAAQDLPREYVSSGGATSCDGHAVAAEILRRESGCDYGAYNPSGCSGRGCVGLYQLDEGHFAAVSPWNSSTSGVCHGLDSSSPADQDECASRLGPGAWG